MTDQFVTQAREFAANKINETVVGLHTATFGPIKCLYGQRYMVQEQQSLLAPYVGGDFYFSGGSMNSGTNAIVFNNDIVQANRQTLIN